MTPGKRAITRAERTLAAHTVRRALALLDQIPPGALPSGWGTSPALALLCAKGQLRVILRDVPADE